MLLKLIDFKVLLEALNHVSLEQVKAVSLHIMDQLLARGCLSGLVEVLACLGIEKLRLHGLVKDKDASVAGDLHVVEVAAIC